MKTDHFQQITIGIAGAGGLGSNLAYLLTKAGFPYLKVVDFDRVERSNLNRQFYFPHQVGMLKVEALKLNLLIVNPHLHFEAIDAKVDRHNALSIFSNCCIVAECLDKSEEKSELVSSLLSTGKFIVAASGVGGYGDSDTVRIHRIKDNLHIVGDLKSDVNTRPPLVPKVMVVAAMMADTIMYHAINRY